MPEVALKLIPTVDVEKTATLNESGISDCNLIRIFSGLPQKLGGWTRYYPGQMSGIPRALHAWADLSGDGHLGIGTTSQLGIISDGVFSDITPQQKTTNPAINFSTVINTPAVTVVDPGINNVTTLDTVFFNTPISVGGLILSGLYSITSVLGATSYTITASSNATATVSIVGAVPLFDTTIDSSAVVVSFANHGLSVDDLVVFQIPTSVGGVTISGSYKVAIVVDVNNFTITVPAKATSSPYTFTVTAANATAGATYTNNAHTFTVVETIVGGTTLITSGYDVPTASGTLTKASGSGDATITFSAFSNTQAMNDNLAQLVYGINLGPPAAGTGYGVGTYGSGAYGLGTTIFSSQTGTPITATNWSLDNWGEILLACPAGGGIYYYSPTGSISAAGHVPGGFSNAANFSTGPAFNGGIFVVGPAQILAAWGSSINENIGVLHDPLAMCWSDSGDFTNWVVSSTTQAGNYHIPTGSKIVLGMWATQQGLIWTDIDLWSMVYQGPPLIFGFNKIGSGCGLIGQHAAAQLSGLTFWMSNGNFFVLGGGGVKSIPCSVWDFVFQDLDVDNAYKVTAGANSLFNEVRFDFPSLSGGTGENDKFVIFNMDSGNWVKGYNDAGISSARSAWYDQSILGQPIGAAPDSRLIYQHETSNDADGQPMPSFLKTGNFALSETQNLIFVDRVAPDFKWGQVGGSQNAVINMTIGGLEWPNSDEDTYGPMTFDETTLYDTPRIRARLINFLIECSNIGSFWRMGNNRVRATADGRQ